MTLYITCTINSKSESPIKSHYQFPESIQETIQETESIQETFLNIQEDFLNIQENFLNGGNLTHFPESIQ